MFNNVALDVFIGIVLIFLLYSLLVTIVSEIITSWMALRSRVLRLSIEKMLNDGYHQNKTGVWAFIQRYFLKEFPDFKNSFAGRFYQHPSVKYLSSKAGEQTTFFSQTKPSYISADMFANTLLQLLKEKGAGSTDIEKVKFALEFNTLHIQPSTLKHIGNMAETAGDDFKLFSDKIKAWYDETQERATGWYKRKLQLILFFLGLIIAIIFNVDTIRIVRILSKDEDARDQLVTMGIQLSKDSTRYEAFINSNGDTVRPKAILDSGYNLVRKDIDQANVVLGLGWNTSKMTKPLKCVIDKKDDKKEYKAISSMNLEGMKERQSNIDLAAKSTRLINELSDSIRQNIRRASFDTLSWSIDLIAVQAKRERDSLSYVMNRSTKLPDSTRKKIDSVWQKEDSITKASISLRKKLLDSTRQQIVSFQQTLPLLKEKNVQNNLLAQTAQKYVNEMSHTIDSIAGGHFVRIDSVKNIMTKKDTSIVIYGKRKYGIWEKINYVRRSVFKPVVFLGLFLTALMLSLGAPFWFDLLKKLVALRSSGGKPEDRKAKPFSPFPDPLATSSLEMAFTPPVTTAPTGDVYDTAVRTYGPGIIKIPGVTSVVKGITANGPVVQINVADAIAQQEVLSRFPTLAVGNTNLTPLIVITGSPVTHQLTIANKSLLNGRGSLGCVLKEKNVPHLHILSCWHVLKGNTLYDEDDDFKIIMDQTTGLDLASRWAGGIKGPFDFSIAQCLPQAITANNNFLRTALGLASHAEIKVKAVTDIDVNKQIPVRYYDCISAAPGIRNGVIYTDCAELEINYADKPRILQDLLVLTQSKDVQQTISQPGNSGSVVFDAGNNAIAMIIGGDKMYTYAIRLSSVFSLHDEMSLA